MPFIVVAPGRDDEKFDNYYPAEQRAKELAHSTVVYQGVRGMEVKVWPL